jgi:hypothetical protein
MNRRTSSRAQDSRRTWLPVFMICLLALAASAHFYDLYVAKSAAAGMALRASQQAGASLAGVKHDIFVAEDNKKSLTARVATDQTRYSDELDGIPGPGLSGMVGMGPLARDDQMILDQDSQILQTAAVDIQAARRTAGTIERAIAADDREARLPQDALAWSLIALISSGLLTVASGALNARRFIVRRRDHLPGASPDWRRIYAAGGWTQVLTVMLVDSAVSALAHVDDRDRYDEEWTGDMADISGKCRRAWWAITLRISALRGINGAREELSVRKY